MMISRIIFLLFTSSLLFIPSLYSQSSKISGQLTDPNKNALIGASVSLKTENDSLVAATITDFNGHFDIFPEYSAKFTLEVIAIGVEDYYTTVNFLNQDINLGTIELKASNQILENVNIIGRTPPIQQKEDTTQFNANSYKTNPDANAEDLLRKMPGMDMNSGAPKAQGEQITKVLIDGKPFFGDDPSAALKNLPAEVIDKIQLYDEKSDQAQFSGFDDGNTTKTINIITKADKKEGVFGKIYAGYGTENRYNIGTALNYFKGTRRLTLLGHTNNINIQNFSSQDIGGLGGSGRGGRGRGGRGNNNEFMVDQSGGITRTNAFGLNYSDMWGKKIEVNGSYFFNEGRNTSTEDINRTYVLSEQLGQTYEEQTQASNHSVNHRANLRLNYTIDSFNSILLIPSLSIQSNNGTSSLSGKTLMNNADFINSTFNDFNSNLNSLNAKSMFLYRRKFQKQGRTFSLWANGGYNYSKGDNQLYAINSFESLSENDTVNQISDLDKNGWNINTNLNYTEPITKKSAVQIQGGINYQQNISDKLTHNYSPLTNDYNLLDSALSNNFNTEYITKKGGITYRFTDSLFNFNVGVEYQRANLFNQQTLPYENTTPRNFNNVLPRAMFAYNFSPRKSFRLFYRTSTESPSVDKLQDVIDNTNPLQLTAGNSALKQTYQHRLFTRYSVANPSKGSNLFLMISANYVQDYVANSTIIANAPMYIDNIYLDRGAQYTKPVNMDGYLTTNAYMSYGMPLDLLKSNLNINAGVNFIRTPGLINEVKNYANNINPSLGLTLSSNISERLDFTIASNSSLNFVSNTVNKQSDNRFFNQNTKLMVNYIFWKDLVVNTDISHQLFTGLSDGFNQNFLLWNFSFGKKILKQKGEIKITVYDLLKQNSSINRTVTELYAQDTRTNVLQRYVMATFTYNLRFFRKGTTMNDALKDNNLQTDPGSNGNNEGSEGMRL